MMNLCKTLTVMKITAILLFAGAFQVIAGISTYSQETKLNLNLKEVAIKQVFEAIEEQSEFIIFYNDKDIDKKHKVNINLTNVTVETILDSLFYQTSLSYDIIERQIVIIPKKEADKKEPIKQPDKHVVMGLVTDAKDHTPLPGVNISIQGTSSGTSTGGDGKYALEVENPNAVLKFSFLGYISQDIALKGKTILNVALEEDTRQLNEVVVMGYSEKSLNEISSSVQVLDSDELLDVTASNIGTMLQGKVSGVQVVNNGGNPGTAAEIRIRGTGSISASAEPLYVVDGIIGGDFSPNDVATITVLKDAGATGLYGSRAAGGVIIVTTKKGSADKMHVNLKTSTGFRQISNGNFQLMNGPELYEMQRSLFSPSTLPLIRPLKLKEMDFDWIDESFHSGLIQDYYLSISGKNDKVSYYFGADVYDEEGTLLNTDFRRFSFRSNLKYEISKRINLSTKLNISKSTNTTYQYNSLYDAYLYLPWDNPYDAEGNPRFIDATSSDWYSRDKRNYIHSNTYNSDTGKGLAINGDVVLNIRMTDWLSFSSSNRLAIGTGWFQSLVDPRVREGLATGGSLYNSNDYSSYAISSNMFKLKKNYGEHSFNGLIGFEAEKNYYEFMGATGQGIPVGLTILNAASVPFTVTGTRTESAFTSGFSQLNYKFRSRYFLTLSYRMDGSSKFGENNRWGSFPSAAASWLISEEDFMENFANLDQLKARASYGITGNANIGDFQHLAKYAFTTQYAAMPAGFPQNLPNPSLGWEKAHTMNLGLDLSLYKRLGISLDVYDIQNKNLLLNVPLSPSSGFEFQTRNSGTVQNRGVELQINSTNIQRGDFTWESSVNFSLNRNKVISLSDGIDNIITGVEAKQKIQVGKDIYTWYMPKWLGVDPLNGDPLWEKIIYDENGVETSREATNNYNEAQFQEVGSATPKFLGGFMSNMKYKSFGLNMAFNYVVGNQIYHRSRQFFDNDGAYISYNIMKLQDGWSRWEQEGDIATHPKAIANGNKLSNNVSSRYIEDGSYLKLRNITFSYALPQRIVRKLDLGSARVFISGDNLWTWTKFSGMDPEVSIVGDTWTRPGTGDFKYPISKQILFGVDLTF
ncbi:MAG: SusC/RagA family TonB-linked outer membrane protein [Bacteroidota bacterium]|nr:SusC/RagA family TonB-linked outer membrane protein [Bacteroidota bacterium]